MKIFLSLIAAALVIFIVIKLFIGGEKNVNESRPVVENPVPALGAPAATPTVAASLTTDHSHTAVGAVHAMSDQKRMATLNEILTSKNDNDPRLDTDFNDLTESSKLRLREKYTSMKPEMFNQKGTVVFLLGRNLTNAEDFKFLEEVLSEPPCLSLADCSQKPDDANDPEAAHLESVNNVTLNYPQIVALKAIQNTLEQNPAPSIKAAAIEELKHAEKSKSRMVSKMAREIHSQFP